MSTPRGTPKPAHTHFAHLVLPLLQKKPNTDMGKTKSTTNQKKKRQIAHEYLMQLI